MTPSARTVQREIALKSKPLVSVIIPTRNSSRTLYGCLRSIKNQTYKNIDVIVVDNYSSDNTEEVAKLFDVRFFRHGCERSAQMNYGAQMAEGEYFLFSYSDFYLKPGLVEHCVDRCESDTNVDALFVPVETKTRDNFWVKCRALERKLINLGEPLIECPRFYKRRAFEKVGGFDETLIIEDYDILNRMKAAGLKIVRSKVSTLHEDPSSLKDFVLGYLYFGKNGVPLFIRKHGSLAMAQYSFIRPTYIRHFSVFKKDPLHATGLLFCRLVYYMAAFFGMLTYFFHILADVGNRGNSPRILFG